MAKLTDLDRVIESLRTEIAAKQLALDTLLAQKAQIARKPRQPKAEDLPLSESR